MYLETYRETYLGGRNAVQFFGVMQMPLEVSGFISLSVAPMRVQLHFIFFTDLSLVEQRMRIAGLKTPIYQYQVFGVYWQMITSRGIGGGFLADDMGLGKTLSYLAYIVVERQLAVLHRNVVKSRETKDGKHLLAGQDGQCPTTPADGWIICPCSASSPTSKLALQPGLRMACVPAAVVKQWWNQWKVHVDTADQTLGMKIAIDHPGVFKDNALTSVDLLSSAAAAQTKNRMEPKKAPKGSKSDDEPKENNDCILLLTTQEDFPKLVKEFSKVEGGYIRDPKDRKYGLSL